MHPTALMRAAFFAWLPIAVISAYPRLARADYPFCNADGACSWPESCGTCPMECGTCDVTLRAGQTARYIDGACEHAGDGMTDACAEGPGGPGRFNDLQTAIESLAPGQTLFIHPGDYFGQGGAFGPGDDGLDGAPDAPIILTAADRDNPPTIHSWDPVTGDNATSHAAIAFSGADVILDHLRIDGMAIVWGTRMQMQYLECTHGWEVCDGNWSCLRAEYCTDCRIHHNYVHDVFDTTGKCAGQEFEPREAGLKEFNGERNIWEFNSVISAQRWGYDLHRNSIDTIVRFNLFQDVGSWGINIERATNNGVYGNLVVGAQGCMEIGGLNEQQQVPHNDDIHHNTCVFGAMGYSVGGEIHVELESNITALLGPGGSEGVDVALAGEGQVSDCNAWDDNSWYSSELYETYFHSLVEWQAGTGYDDTSIAAPGGACTFVDPPTAPDDFEFDLHVASGPCMTLSCEGGEVGPYGITPCVGHACGDVPGPGSGGSAGSSTGGGGNANGGGAGSSDDDGPSDGSGAGSELGDDGDGDGSSGCACGVDDSARGSLPAVMAAMLLLLGARRRRVHG